MVTNVIAHYGYFFSSNSTIGRMSINTWENLTDFFVNTSISDFAIDTMDAVNQSIQEGIESMG